MLHKAVTLSLMILVGAGRTRAQDGGDEIGAVHAPTAQERTAPGTGKFVVFGRDGGVATIWEYVPGERALTKRVSLIDSSWAPNTLFSRGVAPHLIRLQIPTGRGYRVNLYAVDYRSWETRRLHAARQISGLGMSGDSVYLTTDEGVRLLDPVANRVEVPQLQFRKMRDLGALWLVELPEDGKRKRTALFDPERRVVAREVELPAFAVQGEQLGVPWIQLSGSGRFLAMVAPIPFTDAPADMEPELASMTIHVLDLETGRDHELPLRTIVMGGSGVPVIYRSLAVSFDGTDRLRYVDIGSDAGELSVDSLLAGEGRTQVTVDFAPFSRTTKACSADELREPRSTLDYVPSYLKTERPITRRLDLLAEFLERHGVDQDFRVGRGGGRVGYTHCPVAFSPDGRRFFGRLSTKGPARLYYGDLERDELVEVEASDVRVVTTCWVRTPE
ncbi:MAG: hypothetical protein GY711_19370 [bacterium]|nr:hypothetical protein [bacterium]